MSGYTVIDFQTTGLEPSMQHRVVELAVVYVSDTGEVQHSWVTLVNPERDVGLTDLHGIAARDVLNAPRFDDLVPAVLEAVSGRTIVAHNAEFELGFLDAELRRCGVPLGARLTTRPQPGVATMDWFHLIEARRRRRLVDCCAGSGIDLTERYRSLPQAQAVAQLLSLYITRSNGTPPWSDDLKRTRAHPWPVLTGQSKSVSLRPRSEEDSSGPVASWLDRIVSKMPSGGETVVDAYLDVLEMALLDRYLSAHEAESLVRVANDMGLERARVEALHHEYLLAMARVAWEDGVITEDERSDLNKVSSLLGMSETDVESALAAAPSDGARRAPTSTFALITGDSVCLTGSMSTPRDVLEGMAGRAGLVIRGLTKHTKLLVAADPDSLSGKAKKARDYEIPIVTEEAFKSMLVALGRP